MTAPRISEAALTEIMSNLAYRRREPPVYNRQTSHTQVAAPIPLKVISSHVACLLKYEQVCLASPYPGRPPYAKARIPTALVSQSAVIKRYRDVLRAPEDMEITQVLSLKVKRAEPLHAQLRFRGWPRSCVLHQLPRRHAHHALLCQLYT